MGLPLRIRVLRWVRALSRPSGEANRTAMAARRESLASFRIRDAVAADIPALAELHATTWAATYPGVLRPPTAGLREAQWREAFAAQDGSWFCLLAVAPDARLVGFAKGIRRPDRAPAGLPEYAGDLNKIYLRSEYLGTGLGRRLLHAGVQRFLAMGIDSMLLFADDTNPTCAFYERWGGEYLLNGDGSPNYGNFGWRDLRALERRLADAPERAPI